MNNKEVAEKIQEILTPEKWFTDGNYKSGKLCLAMAVTSVFVTKDQGLSQEHINSVVAIDEKLMEIVRELFPERLARNNIPCFNDHPDTTYEDVMLVVKHFGVS